MEKEALLTIILQDIKELETLVNTFKGKNVIPDVFIQLSKSKTQGILDEIQLLAAIKETQQTTPAGQENIERPLAPTSTVTHSTPEAQTEQINIPVSVVPDKKPESPIEKLHEPDKRPVEQVATNLKNTAPKNGSNSTVLGEMLGKDKPSFNERLAEKQDPATSKSQPAISDLRKAIGINDRFFFQRELFGGNADLFNQTVDQLNSLTSLDSALAFISTNFNWNPNNEAASGFMTLVKRRFIKH